MPSWVRDENWDNTRGRVEACELNRAHIVVRSQVNNVSLISLWSSQELFFPSPLLLSFASCNPFDNQDGGIQKQVPNSSS